MAKILSEEQINAYANNGFLFPFPVYTPEEAAELFHKYAALEKSTGEAPMDRFRIKAQLPFRWQAVILMSMKDRLLAMRFT